MAKVLYYDANLKGKAFEVLRDNKDGTVDIGTGKTVVVRSCPVAEDPKHGHAVVCEEPAAKAPEPGGDKK